MVDLKQRDEELRESKAMLARAREAAEAASEDNANARAAAAEVEDLRRRLKNGQARAEEELQGVLREFEGLKASADEAAVNGRARIKSAEEEAARLREQLDASRHLVARAEDAEAELAETRRGRGGGEGERHGAQSRRGGAGGCERGGGGHEAAAAERTGESRRGAGKGHRPRGRRRETPGGDAAPSLFGGGDGAPRGAALEEEVERGRDALVEIKRLSASSRAKARARSACSPPSWRTSSAKRALPRRAARASATPRRTARARRAGAHGGGRGGENGSGGARTVGSPTTASGEPTRSRRSWRREAPRGRRRPTAARGSTRSSASSKTKKRAALGDAASSDAGDAALRANASARNGLRDVSAARLWRRRRAARASAPPRLSSRGCAARWTRPTPRAPPAGTPRASLSSRCATSRRSWTRSARRLARRAPTARQRGAGGGGCPALEARREGGGAARAAEDATARARRAGRAPPPRAARRRRRARARTRCAPSWLTPSGGRVAEGRGVRARRRRRRRRRRIAARIEALEVSLGDLERKARDAVRTAETAVSSAEAAREGAESAAARAAARRRRRLLQAGGLAGAAENEIEAMEPRRCRTCARVVAPPPRLVAAVLQRGGERERGALREGRRARRRGPRRDAHRGVPAQPDAGARPGGRRRGAAGAGADAAARARGGARADSPEVGQAPLRDAEATADVFEEVAAALWAQAESVGIDPAAAISAGRTGSERPNSEEASARHRRAGGADSRARSASRRVASPRDGTEIVSRPRRRIMICTDRSYLIMPRHM